MKSICFLGWRFQPLESTGAEKRRKMGCILGGIFLVRIIVERILGRERGTIYVGSIQSLSRIQLFETPWSAVLQASLSITNPLSLPKPMYIELVMPSNHLLICRPLFLPPSIFPSIRVFFFFGAPGPTITSCPISKNYVSEIS